MAGFKDLYHVKNDVDPPEPAIGTFDEMSASSETHPTAFTKRELGWLDAAAIRLNRRPAIYSASVRTPNQHVAYRGTNGHVYELLW